MKLVTLGLAALFSLSTAAASAATYSFNIVAGATTVDGFFVVDDASSNYVGGGTTTYVDLLDYAFTFTSGANSFVATPVNNIFLPTFDMTYASDLSTVTTWEVSMVFWPPSLVEFFGSNKLGTGWLQLSGGVFNVFEEPATLTAELMGNVAETPLPGALPLFATGLGALGVLGWRRSKQVAKVTV